MIEPKKSKPTEKTMIIRQNNNEDITIELADYLEILGSSVRLTILKMLMIEPMDVQYLSHCLYQKGITSTRENTKNHIDKLLKTGLVIKQTGERDNRAVMQYALVPGSIEVAMRTLSRVMKMNLKLELINKAQEVQSKLSFATVKVLGGSDDGHVFSLEKEEVKMGRIDLENQDKYDTKNDVVVSDSYSVVTRTSKVHARLLFENNQWFIEHCEGKNGTFLWERELTKNKKEPLKHGDIITLGKGPKCVRLVFECPTSKT